VGQPRQHRQDEQSPIEHPLSFAQERLWFLEQLEPGTPLYNSSIAFRITGVFDLNAAQRAVSAILERHEVIRSVYRSRDGIPCQIVQPPPGTCCEFEDLSTYALKDREHALMSRLQQSCSKPFDLSRDIMLRSTVLRLSANEHVLLLTMHHIATDGWSLGILVDEFSRSYNADIEGTSLDVDPLPLQYADYATLQRKQLEGETTERNLAYWRAQLAEVPPRLDLRPDKIRPATPDYQGERVLAILPTETADRLDAFARDTRSTPFMILLAALFALLHRYTAQEDLAIGVPIAGRLEPDAEELIGFFVNMLVMRQRFSPKDSFRELLSAVRNTCLDAYDNQTLPFERLVALLQPERVRNRTPLFQVSLTFQPREPAVPTLSGLSVSRIEIPSPSAKFDLSVSIQRQDGTYSVVMVYPTRLFEQWTISRFLEQYLHLCTWVCEHPDEKVDAIELASRTRSIQAIGALSPSEGCSEQPASIVEAFRAAAQRWPEYTALEQGTRRMTYRLLDEQSDGLAMRLVREGIARGEGVAVYLPPCAESILSCLAILKSGACYIPLDTTVPAERTRQLLEEAQAGRVITTARHADGLRDIPCEKLLLDASDVAASTADGEQSLALPSLHSEDAAYVIFTSGSTGQPKGVRIPHRGVLRLVVEPDYVHLSTETRVMHLASPAFDASTFEIWGPLLNGGTCVLANDPLPSMSRLGALIEEHAVNTLWLTSTWFNAIVDEDASTLQPIKQLLVGGEALSVSHVRRALDVLPETQLINGYGPTENTTFTCCYPIPRTLHRDAASVPIGRPIRGTHILVLDHRMEPVAPGVPGELFIGGDGLALEYLHDPELTEAKFVAHPLIPDSGQRMFRSGDRVRIGPSGALEFLGRMDRQLKIRGFRVEPGEIEAVLSQHPGVRDVHVVLRPLIRDEPAHLVGYVLPEPEATLDDESLRRFARSRLPDYMVPSFFKHVSSFPRTEAGKIDESVLPELARGLGEDERWMAPRSDTEVRLAQVWGQLLQLSQLGVRSDFFELGGHSLLAVRLIAQIEREFRITLPLSVLFDAPTIEALARRIDSVDPGSSRSTVIPLRVSAGGVPFFCIPPGGASVYHFSELVRHLSSRVSFYGFQALGAERGERPQTTIEAMATRYIEDLRAVQPVGPYAIGGRCFGAFVAFEMAQQLTASGQRVSLLVLMDPTATPGLKRNPAFYVKRMAYYRRRGHLLLAVVRHARYRVRRFFKLHVWVRLKDAPARRLARTQRAALRATNIYRPAPYPGTITFLGSATEYHSEDTRALWRQLTTESFELHLLPGTHRSMTQGSNLRTFAEMLEQLILSAEDPQESATPQ